MAAFIVHNFVYSTKPRHRKFGWKKRWCLLSSSGGVPYPLKITVQCSAEKSLGPLVYRKGGWEHICKRKEYVMQRSPFVWPATILVQRTGQSHRCHWWRKATNLHIKWDSSWMQIKSKKNECQGAAGPLTVAIMQENVTADLHSNASVIAFQRPCFMEGTHRRGLRGDCQIIKRQAMHS